MAGRFEDRSSLSVLFAGRLRTSQKINCRTGVYICDECIELCFEIIEEEFNELPSTNEFSSIPTQKRLKLL